METNRSTFRRFVAAALLTTALTAPVAIGVLGAGPASASTPKCQMSGLDAWMPPSENGTAGTIYYTLELTNFSGHACALQGFPSVIGTDFAGRSLGSAASHTGGSGATVTLAAGASATTALGVREAGNFPAASCHRTTAAGVRVSLPGAAGSKVVPYVYQACARSGPDYLTVAALHSS